MNDHCELRNANGVDSARCDGETCPFWRLVEHVNDADGEGCAVKHFELAGDSHVVEWLLSVRDRLLRLEGLDHI